MRCLRDTIRYAHYDHFGFDAVFSLRGSLCSTTSVSTMFATFVATLRSDHFGFDNVRDLRGYTSFRPLRFRRYKRHAGVVYDASHIPGILGILQSLELQQYHPQHFLSQWPTKGSGIILPLLLSLYTNAAPSPVSITHSILRCPS